MNNWVVISLGNRFRRDDSVGPYVLQRLCPHIGPAVSCIEIEGDMSHLLEAWNGRHALLIDAMATEDLAAGAILRIDGLEQKVLPSPCTTSSHGINLAEALEMGCILGAMPQSLNVYAVCGQDFTIGDGLSPAVQAAADTVVQEIIALLNTHTGGAGCTSNP